MPVVLREVGVLRAPVRLTSLFFAGAILLAVRSPRADDGGSAQSAARSTPVAPDASALGDAHRRAVAAHVGPQAVTVGEIEDRIGPVPRFQLRLYGRTAAEVVRSFFDKVIVRDVLLSLGAADKHLDRDIAVEQGVERMLSSATLRAIIADVGPLGAIPMTDVQQYYDANRARYDSSGRVQIWRILCPTKGEAESVLAQAKKDGTATTFTQLARDHSIDKATYLRGGNLGLVGEGGVSNEPGVMVDLAVLNAAQGVKDGEMAPAPVPEGPNFAVVWRRGSQPGVHHPLAEVEVQIRDALVRQKREVAEKALLDKLRAQKVSMVDDSAVGDFDVSIDDGKIGARMRPRARGAAAP
jgi:peptidyl-prolyl cis-trans isomerase C